MYNNGGYSLGGYSRPKNQMRASQEQRMRSRCRPHITALRAKPYAAVCPGVLCRSVFRSERQC